jgi:effector-binding domain-containing protein
MKLLKLLFVVVSLFNYNFAQQSNVAVQLVNSDSFYYCTLEMTGSYDQHPEAFMKLIDFCSTNNLEMIAAGIYWNSPENTKPEDLKWELAVYVPNEMKVDEPFKIKKWEYNLSVAAEYDGIYLTEAEGKAFTDAYKYAADNGYKPIGPFVRRFLNQPMPTSDGRFAGRVQILIPVEKKM